MAQRKPRIIKVEMRCDIGMSVQTDGGDWLKATPGMSVFVGPGFPEDDMIENVFQGMFYQLTKNASEEIQFLAEETKRKVDELQNG